MTELIAPSSFPPVLCTKPLANAESGAGADVLDFSVLPQLPAQAPLTPHPSSSSQILAAPQSWVQDQWDQSEHQRPPKNSQSC